MNTRIPSPECVVKVGDGRGFIIEQRIRLPKPTRKLPKGITKRRFTDRRLIVTAAHCLLELPPPTRASYTQERTFGKLASLDGTKNGVSAERLFVDPVGDIAVLGGPDPQELHAENDAYLALVDDAPVLRIVPPRSGPGWVLSLGGRWVRTQVKLYSAFGGASLEIDATEPGMSGSPILDNLGRDRCDNDDARNVRKRRGYDREGRRPANLDARSSGSLSGELPA